MGRHEKDPATLTPHKCILCFPMVIVYGNKAFKEHNRVKHNAGPGWMNHGRVTKRSKDYRGMR